MKASADETQGRDLAVQADRVRGEAGLHDQLVRRIFAAGLALESAAELSAEPEVRRRIDDAIANLDDAVRIFRNTAFRPEYRQSDRGLREELLDMLWRVAPDAEISFSGPVDGALPPGARAVLVDMLREALDLISPHLVPARVAVSADEHAQVTVIEAVRAPGLASGPAHEFRSLRDWAAHAGIGLDIQPDAQVTRFAWNIPLSIGAHGSATSP